MVKKKKVIPFRAWLNKKGLSVDALARETGISYSTIAKWARGAVPRTLAIGVLTKKFPDCPLVGSK